MQTPFYLFLIVFLGMTVGSVSADDEGSFNVKSRDFKGLFNKYRVAQPQNVPWAGSYWAFATDGLAAKDIEGQSQSPAEKMDSLLGRGKNATAWEKENHSCSVFSPGRASADKEMYESCMGWWGHCNAWSSAAIKHPEPRESVNFQSKQYTVADLKGFLTEIWMDSGSLFVGDTDKSKKTGSWVTKKTDPSFKGFWDVTPTSFFYIFTNYIGMMKTSVVIDRFTGDEVWNQPIMGYRILPIRDEDIFKARTLRGKKFYPVRIRMKIYWASDGVDFGYVSEKFNIKDMSDEEDVEGGEEYDFDGRLLTFRLNLSAPLVMKTPTKIESSGEILSGVWEHFLDAKKIIAESGAEELNHTHPDFIWSPTDLYDSTGNANPHVDRKKVLEMIKSEE